MFKDEAFGFVHCPISHLHTARVTCRDDVLYSGRTWGMRTIMGYPSDMRDRQNKED